MGDRNGGPRWGRSGGLRWGVAVEGRSGDLRWGGRSGGPKWGTAMGGLQWGQSAGATVFQPEQFDGKIDTYRTHEDNQPQGYLSGVLSSWFSLVGFGPA